LKVFYNLTTSSKWQELGTDKYRFARNEIKLDLEDIWTELDKIKISYAFLSQISEKKSSIEPSFKTVAGSASPSKFTLSSKYFSDVSLPMLLLSHSTKSLSSSSDWQLLPSEVALQEVPVISGFGSRAYYPTITTGWAHGWGAEYTAMPQLENSLAFYDEFYDSAQLSQYLTGQDDYYGESLFDGRFEGNYIDGVWMSNPYVSESYNFSELYYPEIHDVTNSNGLFNYYDGSQQAMVESNLISLDPYNSSISLIYDEGMLPQELYPHYLDSVNYGIFGAFNDGSIANTQNDTDDDWYGMKSTLYGGPGTPDPGTEIHGIDADLRIDGGYQGLDYYVSLRIETFGADFSKLKINGEQVASGSYIELDRVYFQGVNTIKYHAEKYSPATEFTARLYYFNVEVINSSAPAVEGATIFELQEVLGNYSKYVSTLKEECGEFGLEFTYQLPLVSKESLKQVHINFDASLISDYFWKQYPFSLQAYNYEQLRWESLPLFPLDFSNTYVEDLDLDFWEWSPTNSSYEIDKFRPKWGTQNAESMNVIGYGDCVPSSIDDSDEFSHDSQVKHGGNFLDNDKTGYQVNNLFANEDGVKILYYESDYDANKYQLEAIKIDPDDFYTTTMDFPAPTTSTAFTKADFYDDFLDPLSRFKVRVLTMKEPQQQADADAYLCIGNFKVQVQANTDYLNYANFENADLSGAHISDKMILTSNGLLLGGESGFQVKGFEGNQKFRDDFRRYDWSLEGTTEPHVFESRRPEQLVTIRSLHPNDYFEEPIVAYKYLEALRRHPIYREEISGSLVSGTQSDVFNDDGDYLIYESEKLGPAHVIELRFHDVFSEPGKTFNLYFDIFSSFSPEYIEIRSSDGIIASSNTGLLTGACYNIPAPALEDLYVYSYSSSYHELKIDMINYENVPEEFQTCVDLGTPSMPFYESPEDIVSLKLNRSSTIHAGSFNLMAFSCDQFQTNGLGEQVSWNNRPNAINLVSTRTISHSSPIRFSLDLGKIRRDGTCHALKAEAGGTDLSNFDVHFKIAKKYQECGMLYVQTNASETLSLVSPTYAHNITIKPSDQFILELKALTSGQVNISLFSGGNLVRTIELVPEGNQDHGFN
ncbi:MAG: hypothetical protein DRO90_03150, partial [Candidatus Altiarchaeales archaeon]